MKKKTKDIIVYSVLFAVSLAYLIIAVFLFQKPDGVIGFLLCFASMTGIFLSVVQLFSLTSVQSKNKKTALSCRLR
ncbi:MAG: hypothetical protein E7497_06810 [Ruminococcus sp.]|nr:hypothetical protein [Ruminococcus sp.]